MAIVQPHDIDVAVREVDWVRQAGLASVMLPTGDFDLPSYSDRRFDPLWAACVDTGLPVTFHSGGTPWEGDSPQAMWVTKVEFMWWARRPLWQLIFGGVFERFPDLRVAFTEQGADWIPSMLERLDAQYHSPFERGIEEHLLRRSPSGYWANNCYVGASFMSRGECAIRDEIGVGRIMWGADYPHIEGTWPHSLGRHAGGVQRLLADEVRPDDEPDRGRGLRLRPGAPGPSGRPDRPAVSERDHGGPPAPVARTTRSTTPWARSAGKESGRRLMSTLLGG